jgi:hypothetical protein
MATNGTIVQLRRNSTQDVAPDGTVLYDGEVAINTFNRKLYTRVTEGYEYVEGIPFGVLESNQLNWNHAVVTTVTLDSFDITLHKTAKYFIEIESSGATPQPYYQAMEVIAIHNTVDAFVTRYGLIDTNGEIATVTVDIDDGQLRLRVTSTPLNSNTNYVAKFVRIMQQL